MPKKTEDIKYNGVKEREALASIQRRKNIERDILQYRKKI